MNRQRIAVTGAGGQLGKQLIMQLERRGYEVRGWTKRELDVTEGPRVRQAFEAFGPDVVVHAAACADPAFAEDHAEIAFAVNAAGTRNVALAAGEVGAKLVFVSTDQVFSGSGNRLWYEYEETCPANVYGHSKRAGEWITAALHSRSFIVRTSWLFGGGGLSDFAERLIRLARNSTDVSLPEKIIGSPTYFPDLAHILVQIFESDRFGVYHATNAGVCSVKSFAERLFRELDMRTVVSAEPSVNIFSALLPNSRSLLGQSELARNGFSPMRSWQDAIADYARDLLSAARV